MKHVELGRNVPPMVRTYVEAVIEYLTEEFQRELQARDVALREIRDRFDREGGNVSKQVCEELDRLVAKDRSNMTRLRVMRMLNELEIT